MRLTDSGTGVILPLILWWVQLLILFLNALSPLTEVIGCAGFVRATVLFVIAAVYVWS